MVNINVEYFSYYVENGNNYVWAFRYSNISSDAHFASAIYNVSIT